MIDDRPALDHAGAMARIQLKPHLTVDELEAAARSADDADIRSAVEAIRLVAKGWSFVAVGDALGRTRGWVRDKVKRFNAEGLGGFRDGRADNGRALVLNEQQRAELLAALEKPAPDGGLWNGAKVRQWIAEKLGRPVGKRIGWKYLRRNGFSLQIPQTRHVEASAEKQDAFKKRSARSSTTSRRSSPKPPSKSGHKTKRGSG